MALELELELALELAMGDLGLEGGQGFAVIIILFFLFLITFIFSFGLLLSRILEPAGVKVLDDGGHGLHREDRSVIGLFQSGLMVHESL